jgi:CheY-like chemotaxis protein
MSIEPRLRILHLEDNPFDSEFVQMALNLGGIKHQTFYAMTKAEFASALNRGGFDVILSDSSLPGFDGSAALSMAREKYPEVPFVFVTGHAPEEKVMSLKEAGAKAVIAKSDLKSLAIALVAALTNERAA